MVQAGRDRRPAFDEAVAFLTEVRSGVRC